MSWRRLRVLIQHLPPESHTMTALRNAIPPEEYEKQAAEGEPEKARWSMTEQLLAGITDSLRRLEYILTLANSEAKARKPDQPEPIRRPGVRGKAKAALNAESAEFLYGLINGSAE